MRPVTTFVRESTINVVTTFQISTKSAKSAKLVTDTITNYTTVSTAITKYTTVEAIVKSYDCYTPEAKSKRHNIL